MRDKMETLGWVTAFVGMIGLLVFSPVLTFGFAWIGGWILKVCVGATIADGMNLMFNTTRFTPDFIPLACATLATNSITPQRCEAIYQILMEHGFAINNVSLGVGSFSMQCLETMDGDSKAYAPYTRDTFGIAVKATYAEDYDGKPIMIFKNPKTDNGHFKKSQRGCCRVMYDFNNECYCYQDGLTWAEATTLGNWLQPVFKNGKLLRVFTLDEVRHNLHGGEF